MKAMLNPLEHLQHRQISSKYHQNIINISSTYHQNSSKFIKIHQNSSKFIKIHQIHQNSSNSSNSSKFIKIHQIFKAPWPPASTSNISLPSPPPKSLPLGALVHWLSEAAARRLQTCYGQQAAAKSLILMRYPSKTVFFSFYFACLSPEN